MRKQPIPLSNLHTHTRYCDGADTPREMILAAIDLGMDTLGFSGHSTTFFDPTPCMSEQGTRDYRTEITALKQEFSDRLTVLLGIEQDIFADHTAVGYDYVIGSVHYLKTAGGYVPVDLSAEELTESVQRDFGGDIYRLTAAYFETVATVADRTDCDIIGHFDLIAKLNEGGRLFDEQDPRYLRPAIDALDHLLSKDVIFEINTGAISRGYRRIPYPFPVFLHRIAEKRGRVTLSSDAHRKEHLLHGFSDAKRIAKAAGIGSIEVMTGDGWIEQPI